MTTTPPQRIESGSRRDIGTVTWGLGQVAGLLTGTEPPRLFRTLGRHRKLFRGWLRFAGRLMPGGLLPRRETELVILRVAHLRGSDYEFTQHVRLCRRVGVSDADLSRVVAGPEAQGWTARERAVLAAVDMLHSRQDLDDGTWQALRGYLDERECIELCMLAAHYEMLATVIAVLRIPADRPRRIRGSAATP